MSKLTLNTYDDNEKVLKTFERETYRMKYGTLQMLAEILGDGKGANDITQLAVIVPFLKSVFPEMTDEDVKNVYLDEVIPLITETMNFVKTQVKPSNGAKNG